MDVVVQGCTVLPQEAGELPGEGCVIVRQAAGSETLAIDPDTQDPEIASGRRLARQRSVVLADRVFVDEPGILADVAIPGRTVYVIRDPRVVTLV
jgi:hypothetical protein